MKKTKLAKNIALAIAGTALSVGAISTASAHTMYNTYNAGAAAGVGGTDGWTQGFGNGGPADAWLGTTGGATPFGYTASPHLNWAARIHGAGHSAQISAADADANYGATPGYLTPDIDTAKGAWFDNNSDPAKATGWKHDLDMGLFKSDVTQKVTLDISGVAFTDTNFGFTIFKGQSSNNGFYSHHGGWNTSQDGSPLPDQIGFSLSDIVATTDTSGVPVNLNSIEFIADAGETYTIALGGWRDGLWFETNDGYVLDITTSPVPVPAAVWLFGTALAGLGVTGRRKTKTVA